MTTQSEAIQKQLAGLAADLQKQIDTQNIYANTGVAGIQGAYKGLEGNLQKNLQDITGITDRSRSQIGSDYTSAGQNIGQAENDLRAMLGPDIGAFNAPLQEIQRIGAQSAASKADSLAADKLLSTGYLSTGRQAIGDAQREGVSRQGDLRSQIGAEIGEIQRDHNEKRMGLEAELARVVAEEKEREAQRQLDRERLNLERQRLASENAARAAAQAQDAQRYKGREGLMQWAAANGVDQESLNTILKGVDLQNATGDPTSAYKFIQSQIAKSGRGVVNKGPGTGGLMGNSLENRGRMGFQVPSKGGKLSAQLLNTGLDIYFGNYASFE